MGAKGASPFGCVCQIGVVVRDLDQAMRHFETLGIGPFEVAGGSGTIVDRKVYGNPAPEVSNRISTTQMGPVQLELVQPVSGHSVQREFLERQGEGINHLAFLVEDLETETARMAERGFTVISSGRTLGGTVFAYFDTDRVGGIVVELIQRPPGAGNAPASP